MILSPLLRCGVRREEEIGARLSNKAYMNSTGLIDNPETDMSAMRFCMGDVRAKRKAPLEGRAEPKGDRPKVRSGGNAAGAREGGETPAVMTVHIGPVGEIANLTWIMSAMRMTHMAIKTSMKSTTEC
ncbi:hypothetical protein SAMN06295905_1886 [Devosia lucknowensis]|uniref:Uncharacterized protein n=1 Tax=Devosia lucknowensis TaxID=1096929 RepID=A0A1Y6F666_9HYPH|nr:hypothetical protein SAMN06295905_1886 [Devosia lucknowensis]